MALLDEIIDGSSDSSVPTSDLLRKAWVVSHRLGATELTEWVDHELNGYQDDNPVPRYRGPFLTPVLAQYSGPGGSGLKNVSLGEQGVEEWFVNLFFRVTFFQSTAVLEDMLRAGQSGGIAWPPKALGLWNDWADKGEVPTFAYMALLDARQQISGPVIRGVIDSVRNSLLRFSLELQSADEGAGEKGGPTVAEPEVGQSVTQFITNIYGAAPVAIGPGATQTTTINVGDLGGLLNAARAAGLEDPSALGELTAAAGDVDKPSKLHAFLDRVGSGAYTFVTGVGGQVAKDVLTPMIEQYLGVK